MFQAILNYLSHNSPALYKLSTYQTLLAEWKLSTRDELITLGFALLLIAAMRFAKKLKPLLILLLAKGWLNSLDLPGAFPLVIDLILSLSIALYITCLLRKKSFYRFATNLVVWISPLLLFMGYAGASLYLFYGWLGTTILYLALQEAYCYLGRRVVPVLLSLKLSSAEKGLQIFEYWGKVLIAFILSLIGLFGLLLIWRVNYHIVTDWTYKILFGIEIGGYEFSLMKLFLAIGVFVLLFSLTRSLQNILDKKVFAYTYIDRGISHAIKTAFGYVGLIVAILFALNVVGIKFANVMYILGGLSVGIGLGLQPVVTNFVSGLIMLIERPIRIGDFVDLPGGEGVVVQINVRTTKIRTKDRCTVLIPNNELINSTLRNWTHENKQKRIDISIGVACESDPLKVKDVLLEAARSVPKVSLKPAPRVDFVAFAPSTFEFMVIIYVDHFEEAAETASLCRYAIEKALRENQIKIPYPRMELFMQKET